jgi:hypothetical protein
MLRVTDFKARDGAARLACLRTHSRFPPLKRSRTNEFRAVQKSRFLHHDLALSRINGLRGAIIRCKIGPQSAQSGEGAQARARNFAGRERRIDTAAPSPNRKKPGLFWLRRGGAARSPWRWDHVRISSLGRRLLDAWIHLFRMDDSVRLVQLFAQVLPRRSRLGAGRGLIWRWAGRLGECRAGDEDDAGDNHAKS